MTTLITGASKGIGKELAYEFARHGHDLVLIARSKELLEEMKVDIESKYKNKVSIYDFDLTNQEALKSFLFNFKENIEILINNAGFGDFSFFPEADLDKNLKMVDLNIKSLMHLCHFFSNRFLEENDSNKNYKILNVASIAAFAPGSYMATYFATKAFVLSFSNALHSELKDKKIHVATLCPGATHSDFGKEAGVDNALAFKAAMSSEKVAEITYKDLMKKKRVIITGAQNKFLVSMMKLAPSNLLADMNGKLMSLR
jgi:uncharacterized protein